MDGAKLSHMLAKEVLLVKTKYKSSDVHVCLILQSEVCMLIL